VLSRIETVVAESVELGYGRRLVAAELSFSVGPGITALVGRNGSGKTTLLSAVATTKPIRSGRLTILGTTVGPHADLRELRERLGYLPQVFGFFRRFTLTEFVEYVAWLKKVPSTLRTAAVHEAIAAVDLEQHANRKMASLSGGMIRRAGLAQAIVNKPQLCILDEPSVGLDPEQRIEFRSLVKRLSTTTSVILSTHLLDDIAAIATRVLVLDQGRLLFSGTSAELEARADGNVGDTPLERGYTAVVSRGTAFTNEPN
jgi:ABC-2 type transport system ATP-binding protein